MATYNGSLLEDKLSAQTRLPWAAIAWFGVLLMACYAPLLWGLVRQWATAEDMSHGFFVPLVAGIHRVAQARQSLPRSAPAPNYWGLALAAWGGAQMLLGTLAAQVFIAETAFLVSLAGAVLFLGGTRALKILAFPLFLLVFMFPIPAIVYAQVTLPLQLFASSVAETILNALGVPVLRDGNVLELASQRLSVVEACSGIRSLVSLAFLALVYAYFFDRSELDALGFVGRDGSHRHRRQCGARDVDGPDRGVSNGSGAGFYASGGRLGVVRYGAGVGGAVSSGGESMGHFRSADAGGRR